MSGSARDVQLIIRARNESRQTMAQVSQSIAELNARLNEQVSAAARSEVGIKELEATLASLVRTDRELLRQATGVARYQDLTAQLEKQTAAAAASRTAQIQLEASLANVAKRTAEQNDQVRAARTLANGQERSAASTAGQMAKLSEELRKAGIETNNLATAEKTLFENTQRIGSTLAAAQQAVAGYESQQRAIRETSAALKQLSTEEERAAAAAARKAAADAQFQGQLQRGRDILREAEYIRLFLPVLDALDAKEKQVGANRALEEKAKRDLEAFRRLADNAAAIQRGVPTLGTPAGSVTEASSVAATVQRIVAPAEAARRTLSTLEEQIRGTVAASEVGGKSIQQYADDLRTLEAAQTSLVRKAGAIDAFRQQVAVLRQQRGAFEDARVQAGYYAEQIRTATVVDDALAESLRNAQAAMQRFDQGARTAATRAREVRDALRAQGIDVRNLTDVQGRLLASANTLAPAMQRLSNIVRSGTTPAGGGTLFGLRPYQLQNLGFQVNDVFTQLASGTSITQTLSQQIGQIVQIFPGAFSAIARLAVPIAAVGLAVGTVVAGVSRLVSLQAGLRQFEGALAASADGAIYSSKALLQQQVILRDLGASFEEAGQAVREFVQRGINPDRITQFARASQNLVDVFGGKLPEVAKRVAEAFTSDYDAIFKLNEAYKFLSEAQTKQILEAQREGDINKARTIAFDAFAASMQAGADNANGPWKTAWRGMRAEFNNFLDDLARTELVSGFINTLTRAMQGLSGAIRGVSSANAGQQMVEQMREVAGLEAEVRRLQSAPTGGFGRSIFGDVGGTVRNSRIASLEADIAKRKELIATLTQQQQAEARTAEGSVRLGAAAKAGIGNIVATGEALAGTTGRRDRDTQATAAQAAAEGQLAEATRRERIQRASLRDVVGRERAALLEQKLELAALEARDRANRAGTTPQFAEAEASRARLEERKKLLAELGRMGEAAAAKEMAKAVELVNFLHKLEAGSTKFFEGELAERLKTFDEGVERMKKKFEEFRRSGTAMVEGIPIEEFTRRFNAAVESARRLETVKFLGDTLKGLNTESSNFARSVGEELVRGSIKAQDALTRLRENSALLGPQLVKTAQEVLVQVAAMEKLGKVTPLAALAAQQARAIISARGATESGAGTPEENTIRVLEAGLQAINRLAETRKQIIQEQTQLVEIGATSQVAAEERIREAYALTTPKIQEMTAELRKALETAKAAGEIGEAAFSLWEAKLANVAAQARYVSPAMKELQDAARGAFTSAGSTFFRSAAEAIGQAVAGTKSWAQAFRDVQRAAAIFFADLLQKIAESIIQAQLLRAINSLFGASDGIGGVFGFITKAAESVAVAHSGAMVGDSSGMSRLAAPSWWARAPRMHGGGMPGLAADEYPIIAKRGEEVLSEYDRRNRRNGGGAAQQNSPTAFKAVILDDREKIADALQTAPGERAFLAAIDRNGGTIRQILGI